MNKFLRIPFLLSVIIALIMMTFAVTQVNAQNRYTTDISERLKQRGVPVKYVNTINRLPYEIEIGLQSISENDVLSPEDNWLMQLAQREATLAYRIGTRLKSYKLKVYNANDKLIYSAQTFLYPEDLSQQLIALEGPKIDAKSAEGIIKDDLQLAELSLDKLEVTPENVSGSNGQILQVQVSTKNLETANRALPIFLDSFFQLMDTANNKYGTYLVLCHLTLLDEKGEVLLDYVKDLETGSTQWASTKGLYDGWHSHILAPEPISPNPTPIPTSQPYPEPSEMSATPTQPPYPPLPTPNP